jgi:hypothetical protein
LRALARDGDPRCLSPLIEELRSPALIADVSSAVLGMRRFADQIVPVIGEYLRGPSARELRPRTRSVIRAVSDWPESADLKTLLDGENAWTLCDLGAAFAALSSDPRAAALCAIRLGPAASEMHEPLRQLTQADLDVAVAACGALAAIGHPESVPPGVLAAALRARQDVDLVLKALEQGASRGEGVAALLTTIATDELRFTWPTGEIADDERWRAIAQRLLM